MAPAPLPSFIQNPQYNAVWGPLEAETESNSNLQVASSKSQTIQLNLANVELDPTDEAHPQAFTVLVNGKQVPVAGLTIQSAAGGATDLTLQLPPGSLRAGNEVQVSWQRLYDSQDQERPGAVQLVAQ